MMYLIFYVSHAITRQPSDKSYKSVSIRNNFLEQIFWSSSQIFLKAHKHRKVQFRFLRFFRVPKSIHGKFTLLQFFLCILYSLVEFLFGTKASEGG